MSDDAVPPALRAHLTELHDHLEATETLPLDPRANLWLGEAQAVAADAAAADSRTVIRTRAADLARLLGEVSETGHPEGDAHLDAAKDALDAVLARVDAE